MVLDNADKISEASELVVKRRNTTPSIYKIVTNSLCQISTTSNWSLLDLPCSCVIHKNGRKVAVETHGCNTNLTELSEILHAINLLILSAFYNLSDEIISGTHLFPTNDMQTPDEAQWKLFADRTNRTLAADQQVSYSLRKLVPEMQN
jgi:hypothetical protein